MQFLPLAVFQKIYNSNSKADAQLTIDNFSDSLCLVAYILITFLLTILLGLLLKLITRTITTKIQCKK
ncbi:MAG: hypothetical protein K6F15_04985 [Treponema sp.]|nr:hypothetical protein [Treponema sp.]